MVAKSLPSIAKLLWTPENSMYTHAGGVRVFVCLCIQMYTCHLVNLLGIASYLMFIEYYFPNEYIQYTEVPINND